VLHNCQRTVHIEMESMSSDRHVDLTVDEDKLEVFLKRLIPLARPHWKIEDVKFKTSPKSVHAGALNTMITSFITPDKYDAVMFRIYGKFSCDAALNRQTEHSNIQLIRKHYDFLPNVILSFTNGFCYDYIHGDVMNKETISSFENSRIIARQIALVHSTPVDESVQKSNIYDFYFTGNCADSVLYPDKLDNPQLNDKFQSCISNDELPTKESLVPEIDLVRSYVSNFKSATVFMHGDLRAENMVWNKTTGKITFVDWEASGLAPQPYDIAYYFWRYAGMVENDYSKVPSRDFQLGWLRQYLTTYFEKKCVTKLEKCSFEEELEKLFVQVNVYYLVFLITSLNSIGFMKGPKELPDDINFLENGICAYKEYMNRKDDILSMISPT